MNKKLLVSLTVPVFAAAMALAQSSGSSGAAGSTTPDKSAQSASPSSMGSDQSAKPSDQTTTTSTPTSATSKDSDKEKSLRGCIVKQGSDFFLQSAKDGHKLIKLNSSEDLSAHVGHEVKVRGTESKASAAASTGAQTASNATGSSGASGLPQSDVNAAGSISDKELTVSKIDMVSETCSMKGSTSSNNPSTPPQH